MRFSEFKFITPRYRSSAEGGAWSGFKPSPSNRPSPVICKMWSEFLLLLKILRILRIFLKLLFIK